MISPTEIRPSDEEMTRKAAALVIEAVETQAALVASTVELALLYRWLHHMGYEDAYRAWRRSVEPPQD